MIAIALLLLMVGLAFVIAFSVDSKSAIDSISREDEAKILKILGKEDWT